MFTVALAEDSNVTLKKRKITRRKIQVVLGVLWLVDGLFQLQPRMFTYRLAQDVIAPSGQGQPMFVHAPVHLAVTMIAAHPAMWGALFALIQLSIGTLILRRSTARSGLLCSIAWALAVWYVGEGLGGVADISRASLITGAPGAALLYAIIALAVLPANKKPGKHSVFNDRPAYWLVIAWAALWLGGAIMQISPMQGTAASLSSMIANMAEGAPGWLASLDSGIAGFVQDSGQLVIVLLVLLQLYIGFGVLLPRRAIRFTAIGLGIVLALVFWGVGQSFGQFYSGLSTDPNTGPLTVLLGLAILGIGDYEGVERLTSADAHGENVVPRIMYRPTIRSKNID